MFILIRDTSASLLFSVYVYVAAGYDTKVGQFSSEHAKQWRFYDIIHSPVVHTAS